MTFSIGRPGRVAAGSSARESGMPFIFWVLSAGTSSWCSWLSSSTFRVVNSHPLWPTSCSAPWWRCCWWTTWALPSL